MSVQDPNCELTTLEIANEVQNFQWINASDYIIVTKDNEMFSRSLGKQEISIKYQIQEKIKKIAFNTFRTLMGTLFEDINYLYIWTIENENHLLEISEEEKILDFIWYSEESFIKGNYLGIATSQYFKLWDIELGKVKMNFNLNCNPINIFSMGNKLSELNFIINSTEEKPFILNAKSNTIARNSFDGNLEM